jgi:hypothetical protein
MSFARAEAIRRQARVNLCPSADRVTCAPGGRWEGGWLIFADDNQDGDRDLSESIVRIETAARRGITIAANGPLSGLRVVHKHGSHSNDQRRLTDGHFHGVPPRKQGRGRRPCQRREGPREKDNRALSLIPKVLRATHFGLRRQNA